MARDAGGGERAVRVLGAWPQIGARRVRPLGAGLINETWAVRAEAGEHVLQRVHPVFPPEIHDNVRAVTEHLAARGLTTPRLVPTGEGALWTRGPDGGVWRLLTRVPGVTIDQVACPAQAESAAGLLARFHAALADLDHDFVGVREGVHDTPRHLATLRRAVAEGAGHRLFGAVAPLADALLAAAEALPPLPELPARPVHGDPKINNVVFAAAEPPGRDRAVCLIDLDTLAAMPLHVELGDAWRSWCNPAGEDTAQTRFDLAVFGATVAGYAAHAPRPPSAVEREGLVHGVEWITLELAARFAADALQERYFGWDPARWPGRGEHNLLRARGQWSLHEQVVACRGARHATIVRIWAP